VSFDVNVSQRPREEEPSKGVVRTWVDSSTWDRRLSPNSHALEIYLEFVPAWGVAPERFEKCQCEDDDCSSSLLNLGSRWWPLSLAMRPNQSPFHGASSRIPSSHHSSHYKFFAIVIYPL
jgi:hypothetical protein